LRQACSRESTESKPYGIAATCLRQLEAVVEALANSNGDDVVARDRAAAEVSAWALVSELFAEDKLGASRGTAAEVHRRRAGVSAWLREQVARAAPSEEELFGRRAALTHVAGGRTVSAARAAAAHGDPRLATCLAQIGAGKNVAFYAKQQLTRWRAGSVGKYIDEFSEQAFKLLAGEVERDDDGMGWYQNLGLHMWLAAGPTSPLRDVVKNYLDAVAQQRAANPLPPVATYEALDANQATHLRDVAFNILALAASTEDEGGSPSTAEVRVAFHPLTYSDDVLNASLAWHLFGVLNAIGVLEGEGMDALADEITVAFATQLLGMPERGRCEWAVFVSQHLRDDTRRTKMTGHILRERFEEWKCDDGKIAFIKDVCAVPQESLDDAHALWDVYSAPRP
jgi:nuclear pore complex protein Nup98-Nup96